MAYFVLTRNGDTVIGVTKYDPYQFNLPDVTIHEMDGPIPDLNSHAWDFENDVFTRTGQVLTRREFLSKFTMTERIQIRASVDPIVIDIMNMLDIVEYVNLLDPDTQQSVGYLALTGLITSERILEILQ